MKCAYTDTACDRYETIQGRQLGRCGATCGQECPAESSTLDVVDVSAIARGVRGTTESLAVYDEQAAQFIEDKLGALIFYVRFLEKLVATQDHELTVQASVIEGLQRAVCARNEVRQAAA